VQALAIESRLLVHLFINNRPPTGLVHGKIIASVASVTVICSCPVIQRLAVASPRRSYPSIIETCCEGLGITSSHRRHSGCYGTRARQRTVDEMLTDWWKSANAHLVQFPTRLSPFHDTQHIEAEPRTVTVLYWRCCSYCSLQDVDQWHAPTSRTATGSPRLTAN